MIEIVTARPEDDVKCKPIFYKVVENFNGILLDLKLVKHGVRMGQVDPLEIQI